MKRAIVITGVSSGLGKALFERLRESDALVVGISRHAPKERYRENVVPIECDLDDPEHLERCCEQLRGVLSKTPEITFINNAFMIEPIGAVGEISSGAIANAVQVNIASAMILINEMMKLQKTAKLTFINITSGAAVMPIIGWAIYCSSKAAMRMFFSVLKKQSAEIDVHEFEPGVVDTKMQEKIRAADFPDIETFKAYKAAGKLRNTGVVAAELIEKFRL